MGVDNKTPEFLKKFPLGQVPAMDTPDGPIFESNAMARYIVRKGDKSLYGSNDYEASQIDQWLEVLRSFEKDLFGIVGPIIGYGTYNEEANKKSEEAARRVFSILEKELTHKRFLVGEHKPTLADIVLTVSLVPCFTTFVDKKWRAEFPHLTKYIEQNIGIPQFKGVIGDIKFVDERLPPKNK